MKNYRLATFVTLVNLTILVLLTASSAPKPEPAAVLRGRALELVDDHGRVRAEIKVHPPDPTIKMPDGTIGYPEAVVLRLINSAGAPNVKLVAGEDGAGLVIGSEGGYVQVISRGTNAPWAKLVMKDGREH